MGDLLQDITMRLSSIVNALDELPSQVTKVIQKQRQAKAEPIRDPMDVRTDEFRELKQTAGKALMDILQAEYSPVRSSHNTDRFHVDGIQDRAMHGRLVGCTTQGTHKANIQDPDERYHTIAQQASAFLNLSRAKNKQGRCIVCHEKNPRRRHILENKVRQPTPETCLNSCHSMQ